MATFWRVVRRLTPYERTLLLMRWSSKASIDEVTDDMSLGDWCGERRASGIEEGQAMTGAVRELTPVSLGRTSVTAGGLHYHALLIGPSPRRPARVPRDGTMGDRAMMHGGAVQVSANPKRMLLLLPAALEEEVLLDAVRRFVRVGPSLYTIHSPLNTSDMSEC